jgi:hypothetical protein
MTATKITATTSGKIRRLFFTLMFPAFTIPAVMLALSMSGCAADTTPPPTTSCIDQRFATVAWVIVKDANNVQLSCAQANATDVVLNFGSYTYTYDCTAYTGFTDSGLPPGDYATSMQLLDPTGRVLSDTSINGVVSNPIYPCVQDDIPTVTFGVQ